MSSTITSVLGDATVQELREAIHGTVLRPGDSGYEDACRIWNGAFDERRPAVIVGASGAADVVTAVGFARSNDLPIAVRGGGHSIAGFSSCDGGVMIDLSGLRSVRIDPVARRAYIGPGAIWADVDHESQAHGLATTGGLISTTGVAGFTLGGGIGWLMRKHGLACDNLVGADLVTADGEVVRVDEQENPELLWGLRGGGGNFGIVTEFELALHPVGPIVYAGPIFFPAEHDVALTKAFREWAADAPDTITAVLNMTAAPPLPVVPEEWHGKKVIALIAMSAGPIDEAERHFAALRAVAEPVADLLGPIPYTAMQTLIDPLWEKGIHAYFKATNLARLDDALIERFAELHAAAPGGQCEIHIHQMGGAVARVGDGDTAFSERTMPYVLNCVTGWRDPAEGDAHIRWAREVIAAAQDASTGRTYVNFLGDAETARNAYGEEKYGRLVELKRAYDPTNVFRLNQNIDPA